MSLQRRFSVQFGLTAGLGVTVALVTSLSLFGLRIDAMSEGFSHDIEAAVEKQLRRDGEAALETLAANVREPLLDYDREALARVAKALVETSFAETARIYDNHGRAIADSRGAVAERADAAPAPLKGVGAKDGVVRWSEGGKLLAGRAVCIRDACLGSVSVAVDGSEAARERAKLDQDMAQAQGDFFLRAILLGLVALALISVCAALVGYLLGRRMQQSVTSAVEGLERLAAGDTDVKIVCLDSEMQELAGAVETLAQKLAAGGAGQDPLIAEMSDGLMVATVDGVIVLANPALHALLKAPEPTLVGADAFGAFAIAPTDDPERFAESLMAVREVRSTEGEAVPILVTARVAGRPPEQRVIAALRDGTAMREAQSALEAARLRAEAAEKAKAQFLSVMSHELRTPLNGVLGGAAVLAGTPLDAKQRTFVNVVQNSGKALLKMVGAILTLSKVESGETKPASAPVDLDAVAHEIASRVAEAAAAKGLALTVNVAPGAPMVLSDADRLIQMGVALAENAVKFTEAGSVAVNLDWAVTDGRTEFTLAVADTGPGIAAEDQARIFDRFTQADSSERRSHDGAGLGLTITRQLAESMGGAVSVESAPGAGSTFRVALSAPIDPSAPPKAAPVLGGAHAVVVAPAEAERVAMAGQLAHAGAQARTVDTAADAAAAVQAAQNGGAPVDLVVRTAGLPDYRESGLEQMLQPQQGAPLAASVVAGEEPGLEDAPDYVQQTPRHPSTARLAAAAGAAVESMRGPQDAEAAPPRAAQARDLPDGGPQAARPQGVVREGGAPERAAGRPEATNNLILLAEDNEVNRIVLSAFLRKAGYTCHTAPNGMEAVNLYKELKPAIVLMAAELPILSGLDAARAIRRHEAEVGLDEAPIIGLLSLKKDGEREACVAAGMSDHVRKPVKSPELTAKLERWTQLFGKNESGAGAA